MTAVKFEKCGPQYAVRFPYNPTVVDALKSSVPAWARTWKPNTKEWIVDATYGPGLAADLKSIGCTVIGLETAPPPKSASPQSDWAQALFCRVGATRVDEVFRALSKVFHPDRPSGDAVLQRELTDAKNATTKGKKS